MSRIGPGDTLILADVEMEDFSVVDEVYIKSDNIMKYHVCIMKTII